MAHFAEIDSNNRVLKVVVGCNDDVAKHGGDQSVEAEENFKKTVPLSSNGVRWVQTSYSGSFRGHYAAIGDIFDSNLNIFKNEQPFPSWTLDTNTGRYIPPVPLPDTLFKRYFIWDEELQNWKLDPQYDITVE